MPVRRGGARAADGERRADDDQRDPRTALGHHPPGHGGAQGHDHRHRQGGFIRIGQRQTTILDQLLLQRAADQRAQLVRPGNWCSARRDRGLRLGRVVKSFSGARGRSPGPSARRDKAEQEDGGAAGGQEQPRRMTGGDEPGPEAAVQARSQD